MKSFKIKFLIGYMKCYLSFLILLIHNFVYSQELVYKRDLIYGKAADWQNKMVDLKLDIIYPVSTTKLPMIVFVHGGAFLEMSQKEFSAPFCERLAKSGFVVANVEYRRGFQQSLANLNAELSKAIYRAQQDENAAIRYLIQHTGEYPVNTSSVFICGESAGGVTSLFSAFVSQKEWDSIAPPVSRPLGIIDSSRDNLNSNFRIRGVINLWGGISDTSLISVQEMNAMPALLFHSRDDAEIPFEHSSHTTARHKNLYGSRDIANRYKNNNACYQLYFVKEAAHAYGFSADYISSAVSGFIAAVLEHKCISAEVENKNVNPSLMFTDPELPKEDNTVYKIISLPADVLKPYTGQYQGNGVSVTIIIEGDHLKAIAPDGNKFDFYPTTTENIFLERKKNVRVIFVKDETGKVTEHILHINQNRELHYKKKD